jgi:hypothetical protein
MRTVKACSKKTGKEMPSVKKLLNEVYKLNPETNSYMFEIRLNNYTDIFNDLDPSPLKRRDLDQDFISYMEDSSLDIPIKHNIELHFQIPEGIKDDKKEERIKAGIKTFYNFNSLYILRELARLYREAGLFSIISLASLFTSFFISSFPDHNYFFRIIVEGFNIGGWVFLWEAINILVFKVRKYKLEIKRYKRMHDADIFFHCNQ